MDIKHTEDVQHRMFNTFHWDTEIQNVQFTQFWDDAFHVQN